MDKIINERLEKQANKAGGYGIIIGAIFGAKLGSVFIDTAIAASAFGAKIVFGMGIVMGASVGAFAGAIVIPMLVVTTCLMGQSGGKAFRALKAPLGTASTAAKNWGATISSKFKAVAKPAPKAEKAPPAPAPVTPGT